MTAAPKPVAAAPARSVADRMFPTAVPSTPPASKPALAPTEQMLHLTAVLAYAGK